MLVFVFALQTLLSAAPGYAQLAAAPSGQRPLLDAAANGTPIVLIAPPSPAGVSRNVYGQFDVGAQGVILNNSSGRAPSVLGGTVAGNPQLGRTPARLSPNEGVGGPASQLRGTIEIAGRPADLVIANPNGITCSGCGFLNSPRVTLSTGAPQIGPGGSLTGFDVRQGVIGVQPGGLWAHEVQQLDLLARGLVVDGDLTARELRAVIGANQIDYASLAATPQSAADAGLRFAIDIKDLGAMRAGQAYLIATDRGLGVNSTGRLAAMGGSLQLSSNGDLRVGESYAATDLSVSAQGTVT